MPSTLKSTVREFTEDDEVVSAQAILDSEAGPSRHPLRSKKIRQNLPYARTKKNLERSSSEQEGGFLNSVKSILSLKWLRNSPTKPDVSPVVENNENVDSDSDHSSNMDTLDNDNQEQHDDETVDVNRESIRSRKDLVIDSDKGKKVSAKQSGEPLYPRVPSFDSTKFTPLRGSNSPMVDNSQPLPTQGDAEIIEYVRRVGRESLAKKQAMVSDELYTSKSPFRFAKQRAQAPTRTPSRNILTGLNSVGRRPFSQNLSPTSPGSEQQTKRRKTVEPSANETVDRFGAPQFPFTPSEARRIMENIESISSPFSEAKRSSSTLRKSSNKRSILLEDDIAPPTRALSVPLSLPGLPYSKGRRAVSKAPSRLSEVSEFLSSVNEKKKKISQEVETRKSTESDVSITTDSNSADELSTQNVTTVGDHSPSKTDFSFGSPIALSDIKAPSLPVEFKRTEVEKPVDESSHTLKKYSLKMKTFSTRQHGSSNRFSARDEDLDSEEEDETLKTIAPAPLLNVSGGFGFATPKTTSATTTNILSSTPSGSFALNKTPHDESNKGSSIGSTTEAVTTSAASSLGNTEVKSTLSGFSFGSLSPSVAGESQTADKSTSVTPEASNNTPTQTKLAGFSFGNSIASADVPAAEKPEVTNSGFSFSSPKKAEKPIGFSFGSPSISDSSDKDTSSSIKSSFGSLGATSLETETSKKPGFSFSSPATEEFKAPTFAFGTPGNAPTNTQLDTATTKDKNEQETKTASFSFGAPSISTTPAVASESTTVSNPTFTFGTPVANDKPLGFGSQAPGSSVSNSITITASADKPEESLPKSTGFTFGATSTTPSGQPGSKTSGFTFGGADASLANKPAADVATFSFGAKDSTSTDTSESKPGFSFGGIKAATSDEGSKIAGFTFGDSAASSNSTTTEPKPSGFSFNSTTTSDVKTTSFGFGTPASQNEGSTLIANTSTPADGKSTFTFGTPATTSSSSQSGFAFSTPTTQTAKPSSFSFGVPSSTASETPKANEVDKPSFGGFGTTDSKSSFTFGASTAGTSTPAFGAPLPSAPADSKPAPFAFGAASTQSQPSGFTFGAPATQASTFSTTPQSQATPAPFTFGTSNSNDAMSSTPPTGFGGFGANSSTPAITTPNPSAPFTFGGNSSDPSTASGFSFGANTTSQPSSMSFGGGNSGANTSSFAFGNTSTTGFSAPAPAQPQTTSFGGNSNFSFGASQPAASQPSTFAFGSGNGQAGAAPGNGFNFNGAPNQPAPFAFGASTPAPQASFGFNGAPASGAQPAAPGGFSMGSSTVPAGRKIARPKRRTR